MVLANANRRADSPRENAPLSNIRFHSVYPGIDVVYYGSPKGLFEYDFEVAPHARPADIRLSFPDARKLRLDESGDLLIDTSTATLKQYQPQAYQEVDGVRHAIHANYKLIANNEVIFELEPYDKTRPLIIDPSVTFATFLGGSDFDQV